MTAGRPSKLTQETIKTLTDAIGLGASYVDACIVAGISYEAFMKWKQRGKADKSGEYVQFLQTISRAKSEGKMRHLANINNAAAKGEWKASLEWLKRLDRENWGDNVDVTSGNKPLEPKENNAGFERAISTLADALREVVPAKDNGQNSEVDTPK